MSPASLFLIVALFASGVCSALQGPTNALLAQAVRSPINAAFISFAVGTVVLGILVGLHRVEPNWRMTFSLPWYAWMGGAYGAVFVSVLAFSAPRIGIAQALTLLIAGQACTALVLDHFGAFGLAARPVTLTRALGMAVVVLGVLLVRKS